MAIARVGALGNAVEATTVALVVPVSGGTAGNLAVCRLATDNSGASGVNPSVSFSDPRGNVWNQQSSGLAVRDPAGANAGAFVVFFMARILTPYQAGDNVTITTTPAAPCMSALIDEWSGVPDFGRTVNSGTGGTSAPAGTAVNVNNGEAFIIALAVEGNAADVTAFDTDTTNGNWVTTGTQQAGSSGTNTNNQTLAYQHKIVNASGNQTWNYTLGSALDWAGVGVIFAVGKSQAVSGGMTPAGTLTKLVIPGNKTGGMTPAGALAKQQGKPLAGAMTPTGPMAKQDNKPVAGGLTPTGVPGPTKIGSTVNPKSVDGGMTPSGAAPKIVAKPLSGAFT